MPYKKDTTIIQASMLQVAVVLAVIVFCSTTLVAFIANTQMKANKYFDVETCEAILQEVYEDEIKKHLEERR